MCYYALVEGYFIHPSFVPTGYIDYNCHFGALNIYELYTVLYCNLYEFLPRLTTCSLVLAYVHILISSPSPLHSHFCV